MKGPISILNLRRYCGASNTVSLSLVPYNALPSFLALICQGNWYSRDAQLPLASRPGHHRATWSWSMCASMAPSWCLYHVIDDTLAMIAGMWHSACHPYRLQDGEDEYMPINRRGDGAVARSAETSYAGSFELRLLQWGSLDWGSRLKLLTWLRLTNYRNDSVNFGGRPPYT